MYFQEDGTAYTQGYKGLAVRYHADADGNLTLISKDTGYRYYFKTNGNAYTYGFLQFVHTNGNTYRMYFQADGTAYTDGYKALTYRYQADADGNISLLSNDTTYKYYFMSNGNAFTGGLLKFTCNNNTCYYYFQADGTALTSSYKKITKLSTADADGNITSEEVSTCAYYFNDNGYGTAQKKWVKIDGSWYYFNPDTFELEFASDAMYAAWQKIKDNSSNTKYYIVVDTDACETMIFKGSAGNWEPYKDFSCAPGADSTPTVKGTYTIQDRGYSFGTSSYTCYYWTRFYGNYLFHSVLYYANTKDIKDGRTGMRLSHGCVRLDIDNAKFIYDYMTEGTKVYIY